MSTMAIVSKRRQKLTKTERRAYQCATQPEQRRPEDTREMSKDRWCPCRLHEGHTFIQGVCICGARKDRE